MAKYCYIIYRTESSADEGHEVVRVVTGRQGEVESYVESLGEDFFFHRHDLETIWEAEGQPIL